MKDINTSFVVGDSFLKKTNAEGRKIQKTQKKSGILSRLFAVFAGKKEIAAESRAIHEAFRKLEWQANMAGLRKSADRLCPLSARAKKLVPLFSKGDQETLRYLTDVAAPKSKWFSAKNQLVYHRDIAAALIHAGYDAGAFKDPDFIKDSTPEKIRKTMINNVAYFGFHKVEGVFEDLQASMPLYEKLRKQQIVNKATVSRVATFSLDFTDPSISTQHIEEYNFVFEYT